MQGLRARSHPQGAGSWGWAAEHWRACPAPGSPHHEGGEEGQGRSAVEGRHPQEGHSGQDPGTPPPHLHGGVDGRVRAQAEVRAGHIVADGGGDDAHDDAQLLVAPARLHQLQHPLIGLRARREGERGALRAGSPSSLTYVTCVRLDAEARKAGGSAVSHCLASSRGSFQGSRVR